MGGSVFKKGMAFALRFLRVVGVSLLLSSAVQAEIMTVRDLKQLIESGPAGELAATAYFQGSVDGFMAMDSLLHKEYRRNYEFCKFFKLAEDRASVPHPAKDTKKLVLMWEKSGYPLDSLAVDMVLSYITAQFGC